MDDGAVTTATVRVVDVATPEGPARATVHRPSGARRGRLVLGHGAGGTRDAVTPDLQVVVTAAVAHGWVAVVVDQPWKVAGRRVAVGPPRLDVAWQAVLGRLRHGDVDVADGVPLVVGGRSAGARVACRTAAEVGADAVVALAFPLVPAVPPGRPPRSRAAELAVDVPLLVVQGERDRFGGPRDVAAVVGPGATVVGLPGDHALRGDADGLATAVGAFLDRCAHVGR